MFLSPAKRGRFDENGENHELAFYPLKTRASLFRPPKTTKMTKMAGVTQAKAWFRKSRVCSCLRCGNHIAIGWAHICCSVLILGPHSKSTQDFGRGEKAPTPTLSVLLVKGPDFVLTKDSPAALLQDHSLSILPENYLRKAIWAFARTTSALSKTGRFLVKVWWGGGGAFPLFQRLLSPWGTPGSKCKSCSLNLVKGFLHFLAKIGQEKVG